MSRSWRAYKQVFYAAFGFGPYECFFCREKTVPFEGGREGGLCHIHHIDGNPENNHPLNLAPAHNRCHRRWHVLRDGIRNRRGHPGFGEFGNWARWNKPGERERAAKAIIRDPKTGRIVGFSRTGQ